MPLSRRNVILLIAATIVIAAVAILAWKQQTTRESTGLVDEIAVITQPAKVTTLSEKVSAAGSIVPQTAADFVIKAPEPCTIAEMPKQEGETVQPGDVLVRFDVPSVTAELATRQLEVSEATSRMETAKAEATRLTSLYDRGLTPRTQAEAARAALSVAEGALGQARSRLESAKVAEAGTIVRARFAGTVVKRWKIVGDSANGLETDPVMRVVDLSRLQISASLPVVDATRVLPGQLAEVQTEAGPQAATVALKLAGPSSAAPATDVRLNFLTPTTLPLDSLVQVSIVVNERKDVLVVPAEAIQRVDTQTFVWMADANSQATRREIKIGYIANGQAEVVSGLTAGEQVIVAGIAELTEGIRVVIGR